MSLVLLDGDAWRIVEISCEWCPGVLFAFAIRVCWWSVVHCRPSRCLSLSVGALAWQRCRLRPRAAMFKFQLVGVRQGFCAPERVTVEVGPLGRLVLCSCWLPACFLRLARIIVVPWFCCGRSTLHCFPPPFLVDFRCAWVARCSRSRLH